jgi:hypothetical protein
MSFHHFYPQLSVYFPTCVAAATSLIFLTHVAELLSLSVNLKTRFATANSNVLLSI